MTKLKTLAILGALLGGVATDTASAVTFSPNQVLANNGSNLNNSGFLVTAVNFSTNPVRSAPFDVNTDPNPAVTLNGITFTPLPAVGGSNSFYNTNANILDSNRTSGVSSAQPIYGLLFDAAVALNQPVGGDHELNLNLTNLTPGHNYRVQMVFSSDGNRQVDVTSDMVSSAVLNYGPTNGPGLITANFTATGTTQTFTTNKTFAGNPPQLSGFVLHDLTAAPPPPPVNFLAHQVLDNNGLNLSNTGTLITAVNFSTNPVRSAPFDVNSDPNPAVTLNGITFTPLPAVGGSNAFFSTNANILDSNRTSGVSSAQPIYGLLFDAAVGLNIPTGGDHELNLTLNNLVAGDIYRLQMIFSSDGNRQVDVTTNGVSSLVLNYGPGTGPGLLTVDFVAAAASQIFTTNKNFAGNPPQLSGFVLHRIGTTIAVPEPATGALLVASAAGLLIRRRRNA